MIVYEGSNREFRRDAVSGTISSKIESLFLDLGIPRESFSEYTSWKNSLPRMANILFDPRISEDVRIAIEFQIPLTSKRVDFMIAGRNAKSDNVVIIELKQWNKCAATSRENVVIAHTGGAEREVAHPSQQAYAYAKLIENFNESIFLQAIKLIPCCYLHNYEAAYKDQLFHPKYKQAIDSAPPFLMEDGEKLQDFIASYVPKPSDKKLFDLIDHGKTLLSYKFYCLYNPQGHGLQRRFLLLWTIDSNLSKAVKPRSLGLNTSEYPQLIIPTQIGKTPQFRMRPLII